MVDLRELLDHAGSVRPPALAELRRVAARRRRRTAVSVSAAVGAAAAVTVLAVRPLVAGDASPAPIAPEPTATTPTATTPTGTPSPETSPFPVLTPEEIRRHPDAEAVDDDVVVTAAPGVAARVWQVCLDECSRGRVDPGELQQALEVTDDDFETGALHAMTGSENVSHAVDGWFVVGSALVDAEGDRRPLSIGDPTPVEEVAGPLVHLSSGVAWIDLDTDLTHGIDDPGYWDWWGADDTWFWGNVWSTDDSGDVLAQGLIWRNPDGSFGVRMLPIDFTGYSTQMLRSGVPGTMAAIDPGPPRLLHVSTDYGETWDVRVMPESWGTGTSLPDSWQTWVDVWPTWETP